MIWADTDIRIIVETTAQSVIWADTEIRLIVETTAQGVIWADTETLAQCWFNVGHHGRRWTNIEITLGQHLV